MYDLIVIGSGPGGYVGAIRAAQLGLKTACVEKESTLGGTCLNVGCIPSKALLQSTEHLSFVKEKAKAHGIDISKYEVNFPQMMNRKADLVKGLTKGIESLFLKNKVEWIKGEASFIDKNSIKVGNQTYQAKNFLIATGSEPVQLPFLPFDEKRVVSSTGALSLEQIPNRLIVIGGGVIGVEMASIYSRLGSKVTVVEMLDEIVAGMDSSVSKSLQQILTRQGIDFKLKTKVLSAELSDPIKIQLENETLEGDVVLVAVGRRAYTKNLHFKTNDRGLIEVNNRFQTYEPHIYAIGDCIQGPMLAHKAMEEATVCVETIAGIKSHINYVSIPNVVYTSPEAVSVGFTEKEAKALGRELLIGQCSFKAVSRARCMGETDGLIKVIGDKATNRFLGLHIVGVNASELAEEGVLALDNKMTLEELGLASHAHPTLSEGVKEAVLNALGRQIHF